MIRLLSLLVCAVAIASVSVPDEALAAACGSGTTYGSISGTVNIPAAGEYVVWVRLNPPTVPGNVVDVEVAGNTCFTLNSTNLSTSSLSWINYQGSDTSSVMKYSFDAPGLKSVKINGLADDVKVDRVMFIGVGESCSSNGTTPKDLGANCETGIIVGSTGGGDVIVPPPSITTPTIVTAEPEAVKQVQYYVNGELVQTVNEAVGFDTSLLENGEYELTTKVIKKDGSIVEQVETITVSNPPQRFGSLKRWARRNRTNIIIGASSIVSLSGIAIAVFGLRARHHNKMFMIHHGLGA